MKLVSTFFLFLVLNISAFASDKIKITDLSVVEKNSQQNQLVIKLADMLKGNPEILIKDKMLQVSVPDTFVWPKIDKTINGTNTNNETKVSAYQFSPETVRVRALLPYSLEDVKDRVSMTLTKDKIIIDFPKIAQRNVVTETTSKEKTAPVVVKKANTEQYDESYLERLLKEKEERLVIEENAPKEKVVADTIKTSQASTTNTGKQDKGFSITTYIGKFVAFLAVVLLVFYGLIAMMKKGVFKKSRLGFLNSTKLVEVLNTTYVAPKKSLLLIRAHNQIFLVGSTDKGFHQLGEIKDVASLLKTGEKEIAGDNFDLSLDGEKEQEKDFKLKDLDKLSESEAVKETKDQVRLSDQIKKKVKNLKQLQ